MNKEQQLFYYNTGLYETLDVLTCGDSERLVIACSIEKKFIKAGVKFVIPEYTSIYTVNIDEMKKTVEVVKQSDRSITR